MDVEQLTGLLKSYKSDEIKITEKTREKIEDVHKIKMEEIKACLENPEKLEDFEEQPARREGQRTFRLVFKKSSRRMLCIVVTENMESKTLSW